MQLTFLNLANNNVTHLPAELHTMSLLLSLDVDGNPLMFPPINVSISVSFLCSLTRLCDCLGQFKRSLKTHLFGVWDRGAL